MPVVASPAAWRRGNAWEVGGEWDVVANEPFAMPTVVRKGENRLRGKEGSSESGRQSGAVSGGVSREIV